MKYETIKIYRKKDVTTVAFNRPEVHNAMNEKLMKELTSCFKKLSQDDDTRIIILTGNGKSFCAGADLNWMKSISKYSKEENIQDSGFLLNLYETIYTCPKTVIGRINGHAFGGGVGLIAVCDITIAIPSLKFAFSETKLGIIPSVISTYIVRRIGLSNMRRLFITGERFNSDYAKEIGLIDYVVPEEEFDLKIQEYVDQIHSSGPNAIIEVKNLVNKCQKMDVEEYKKYTVEKIAELRVSTEGQEGVNAFLEKRKTKWCE
ncbi:enoyl-CoA hydratase/carnithine racemase [Thermoplasmatales archaeon SCGC AB-539-N05]|nr:enoyl-CoA hydratase/carnithine racemase [Thermoplasmatales archaeon SCGC AB-539-N05]